MPGVYGAIDLQKNELRQAVIQNVASAPSSPIKGQLWFDSTNNILKWYDGGTWVSAMGGAGAVPSDSVTTQAIGDAAVPGVSALYARGDHKHAMPAFGTITAQTAYGAASGNGSAATIARSDHTHGTPSLTAVAPSTQAIGDAAVVGTGTAPAREDHKHAMPAFGASTATTTFGLAKNDGAAVSLARSDHTHGTPTHDAAAHSAIPLNSLAAATGIVYMGGFVLANLGAPSAGTDAANKAYVDNLSAGLSWSAPVRVATTANVGLSGLTAIDGVTPAVNDRVLVKNQTTPSQNGIYIAASGAWARATDADAANELLNAAVFVSEGTTQSDTAWVSTANAPITVGTTSLPWVQFSGAGTYTNGTGITLTGNVFAIDDTIVATDAQVTSAIATHAGLADPHTVYQLETEKGAVNGYASLDGSGDVPIAQIPTGTSGTTVAIGNDARFTDSRNPTGTASGDLTGTYPGPTIAALAVTDAKVAAANKDGVAGTASMRTLGTGAQQAAAGSHGHVLTGAEITGTLPIAKGGTNGTATPTAGGIAYGTGTAYAVAGAGTAGYLLASGAAGAPTWVDPLTISPAGVAKKYAAALTGTTSPETITHNLNTRDIQLTVLNGSTPYTAVEVDWDATTVNTAVIRYSPNLGAGYRVVVVG